MRRRDFLATGTAAAFGSLATPRIARAQDARVLRFVPQANLSSLDAVAGTQYVVRNASLLVWDTLFGVDHTITPKPQMAESYENSPDFKEWTIKLRPGLKFHDGEPVLGRDVVASLQRWMVRDTMGQRIKASLLEMSTPDDKTIRIRPERLPESIVLTPQEDRALLALQGPEAAAVMARLSQAAAALPFMGIAAIAIDGIECLISRSGYTGEDGFEISVPAAQAEALADKLIAQPEVVPIGLGARDSLRLEAGLCLYGNDLDELTSPIEAGLNWVIGKRRKMNWDFLGGLVMRDQLDNGPIRRRVGIRPDGRSPARAQTTIMADDGTEAGTITSGSFGPSVNAPVAMGYVRKDLANDGTRLNLIVRGRTIPATVVPLPFVPHRYIR